MKFSIRDLFLVTVIVAILTAWWVDHRRQAAENIRVNARLREAERHDVRKSDYYGIRFSSGPGLPTASPQVPIQMKP